MPLLARLAVAWLAGIGLAGWLNLPWPMAAAGAVPALSALFMYRQQPRVHAVAVLAVALLAGVFRLSFFQPVFTPSDVAFYNDQAAPVTLTGRVVAEPDVRDYYLNLRLEVETLTQNGVEQPVEGLVLVRAPRYPARFYGDRLAVTGRLETPPIFDDFSYKDYLARFGIHSLIRRPQLELVESGQGHPFWAAMLAFKAHASQTINRILSEPHASLLNGILLGIETGIPRALYEDFNLTGTSHIIVISGSNIAVVAGVLLLLGQRLWGKRWAPPLTIAGIIVYTLLVGADPAVTRAALMGGLWVLALWVGRPNMALNALFFSALIMSLLNPLIVWDVGFQLSFAATLGLIILVPPLEQLIFGWLQRRLNRARVGLTMALLSELLIVSLAAQIITAPLIVYHFGRLSLVSLLSNLLILPAQPPIMGLGAVATLLGMIWLPLGQLLGWLVWLPLAWTVTVVEWSVKLPYASLDLGGFPLSLVALSYLTLGAGLWWVRGYLEREPNAPRFSLPRLGAPATRLWLGGLGTTALLLWLAVAARPDGRLHVAFLDVGQGDAVLITLPDGRQMLIDGGDSASTLTWRLGQEMPFWDRSLDVVLNTHPDADHLGGLLSVVERYQVEQVLVTDVAANSQLYRQWEAELAEAQLDPLIGQAGMQLDLGSGLTATVLSPGPAAAPFDAVNNHSLVLHLRYGDISFLLPGDIEAPVERNLLLAGTLPAATVLKSPHHGSKTSSSDSFLAAVNSQIVVISVGADNRFGHPAPEVLERYAAHGLTVLRTDERGTIEFSTDGQRLWVETAR